MATLSSIAELAWLQLGGGTDEAKNTLEEFIETAKGEYAWQTLQLAWKERREEGMITVPSHLATMVEKAVVNNEVDICDFNILDGLPNDMWLMNIGGLTCSCKYIKSTINQSQLLCDDDSIGDAKTYIVVGNKIIFPKGTHKSKLQIIYANNGQGINANTVRIDEAVGAIVRTRLIEIYVGKTAPLDKTNNSNPNT